MDGKAHSWKIACLDDERPSLTADRTEITIQQVYSEK